MRVDSKDNRKSKDYIKGLHIGKKSAKADIGNYVRGMLIKLYELAENQPEGKDNNEAIFVVSSIYSYIYGTDKLFREMYTRNVLLTEPEILFGRVANDKESKLSLQELHMHWIEEMAKERKDKNNK